MVWGQAQTCCNGDRIQAVIRETGFRTDGSSKDLCELSGPRLRSVGEDYTGLWPLGSVPGFCMTQMSLGWVLYDQVGLGLWDGFCIRPSGPLVWVGRVCQWILLWKLRLMFMLNCVSLFSVLLSQGGTRTSLFLFVCFYLNFHLGSPLVFIYFEKKKKTMQLF